MKVKVEPLIPAWAWRAALPGWIAARSLVAVAYGVAVLTEARFENSRRDEGLLVWDGGWYLQIARDWYRADGEEVRFAPLFAMAGRAMGLMLGDAPGAGLVIAANLAALVAGATLVAYTVEVGGTPGQARATAWALVLWPASFVLVLAYSEALFIALTAGAALAARRQRWWLAAALGLSAGLTRPTGTLLTVLIAGLVVQRLVRDHPERPSPTVVAAGALAVVAPLVGLGIHLALVTAAGADAGRVLGLQRELRGGFIDPVSRLVDGFADLAGDERFGDGLHVPFALLSIVLVVLVVHRVGLPEGLFATAVVVVAALSADNLNSLERYVMNAFPVFVAVGLIATDRLLLARAVGVIAALCGVAMCVLAWGGIYVP